MSELQLIQSACAALPPCNIERPYVQMAYAGDSGDGASVDVEWVSGEGIGPDEVRMSVTERLSGSSEVLLGAAFDAATGELLRGGKSLSLAEPVKDSVLRASIAADLALILTHCLPVGQDVERAAA